MASKRTIKESLGVIIYNSILGVMRLITWILSNFRPKYRLWINGQKGLVQKIAQDFKGNTDQWIWFHCASLGEFEQGRPLIEKVKAETTYKVVLTFFSPSGYEIRKNYTGADRIYYLPMDTNANASFFVKTVQPKLVFFVKYEYWYHYLEQLSNAQIPIYLISCFFRPNQSFFQWYGSFFVQFINKFNYFFVQDERTKELLSGIGFRNIEVTGDTRFDRVVQIAQNPKSIPEVSNFKSSDKLIVIGSAWNSCVDHWAGFLNQLPVGVKVVLVPHEPDDEHLGHIRKVVTTPYILFSQFNTKYNQEKILVVDNIGMLSSIYSYADLAYVGAGFEVGLHNVLEAAVYGIPVLVGFKFSKAKEAIDLVGLGGVISCKDKEELWANTKELLENDSLRNQKGAICKDYVLSNQGSTDRIFNRTLKKAQW
ncbi:MAG: 3-deoxy-D-manno-octulosonic acid transferase [Cytophagales bacterium]|nr:3-deoxy-D-manno-octulosonic acid transferase [Cytophagales bacterium]